jgi:hypothetical protein
MERLDSFHACKDHPQLVSFTKQYNSDPGMESDATIEDEYNVATLSLFGANCGMYSDGYLVS